MECDGGGHEGKEIWTCRVCVPASGLNSQARALARRAGEATRGAIGPTEETIFGPMGFRVFRVGPARQSGVADAPGHAHIRPRFGLDMRCAGQPGHLGPV